MVKTDLKLCPFCGGKAVFQDMGRPLDLYRIVCTSCGANVPSLKYPGIGEKIAIGKWNTRKVDGVVRCRDCVYYNTTGCGAGFGWCEDAVVHNGVRADFFCANGERRDAE